MTFPMLVILPYANVTDSLRILCNDDLIDQIRQCEIILQILAEPNTDESKLLVHKMWRGYESAVLWHTIQACQEFDLRAPQWQRRTLAVTRRSWLRAQKAGWRLPPLMPRWFGYRLVHMSHQSHLIRHRPDTYARHWPDVPLDMPLLWPQNVPGRFEFTIDISALHRQALTRGELVLRTTSTDRRMKGMTS